MTTIPTKKENPDGLHQKYVIRKLVPNPKAGESKKIGPREGDFFTQKSIEADYIEVSVEKGAEYFVLRLDTLSNDMNHIKACRIGIHAYADAIEPFIPQLAKDIRERYPLL